MRSVAHHVGVIEETVVHRGGPAELTELREFFAGIAGRADDGDFLCFHFQKILTAIRTNNTKIKSPPAEAGGLD